MKILTTRDQILPSLIQIGGIVERKNTMAILANVLIGVEGNGEMTLTATDSEVELKTRIAAETNSQGEFTVSVRKLLDICKAIPEGAEIQISVEGEKALLKSGRGRYSLGVLPAVDYPPSLGSGEIQNSFHISEGKLKLLLEKTSFAMAQQDVRYYLNGLMVDVSSDELRAVATDGHRLALAETKFDVQQQLGQKVIVPRKAVQELSRLLSYGDRDVQVSLSTSFIQIRLDNIEFTSKLIDGKYPDYRRVIPVNPGNELIVGIDDLRRSLQRTSILANEKFRGVHFSIDNNILRVQAHNPEQEEAEEELDVDYGGAGINIGFNVGYMLDVLGVLSGDKVVINLIDGSSSCVLRSPDDEGCLFVIMPMRL